MRGRRIFATAWACGILVCTVCAQRPFRQYPAWEYNDFRVPPDHQTPGEWTFARLMYPTYHVAFDNEAIFHSVFDLDDRYQVPGAQFIRRRRTYEKDGTVARWRGIHDTRAA